MKETTNEHHFDKVVIIQPTMLPAGNDSTHLCILDHAAPEVNFTGEIEIGLHEQDCSQLVDPDGAQQLSGA